MVEPIKSNLEPIEESDLNLEKKIKEGNVGSFEKKEETPFSAERESHMEISAAEKDAAYGDILSKVQTSSSSNTDDNQVAFDAAQGAMKTDAQTQIQHLVDIAMQKGVIYAVKVARRMEDNYILDSFHDRLLAEELHDALLQKGLIGRD